MGLPMFVKFSHEFWEGGNEREMQNDGLIVRYDSQKPLHEQIEECLLKERPQKPILIDWKARILEEINQAKKR
jgi:hypothetical protein